MIHDGHRERLRQRFIAAPSSFEDHELLELLLFYAVPRKNTNELAHALLNKFGSLSGILDAGIPALKSVPDMGESSAIFFRALSEFLLRYKVDQYEDMASLESYAELGNYMKSLFVGTSNEITYIILFDAAKKILACKKVAEGYSCGCTISFREINSTAIEYNAAALIVVHNHPHGKPSPSGSDLVTTNTIRAMLDLIGVELIDHFIVAEGKCIPILNSGKAKLYNQDVEKAPKPKAKKK